MIAASPEQVRAVCEEYRKISEYDLEKIIEKEVSGGGAGVGGAGGGGGGGAGCGEGGVVVMLVLVVVTLSARRQSGERFQGHCEVCS